MRGVLLRLKEGPATAIPSRQVWTRLRCSRCRCAEEHSCRPRPGDPDRESVLCRAPPGSATTFAVGVQGDDRLQASGVDPARHAPAQPVKGNREVLVALRKGFSDDQRIPG